MSDAGERTCPLCAEEMDLTDQQLKPCKCGYDICVWCWHHIMDMAEKDNTEGRCPACRKPYNKEKIVGTASKCERLVTGLNMEKKQKPQKGKIKSFEGRKELGSVRVIQRNLVYVVGLPLDLADEDLLQQKEYFGQYGKVLKVSISRTAAGEIQQFPNDTCSVYITYSKEEEAIRSIQSAHGFILEGRPLRACFGTTKYCHAWLRNTACTNADCLYLHEFGPEEDSFSKDEIVPAFTRNKVQQITSATNDMQRRAGNFLPPPADDYPKLISKNTTNNPSNPVKVSPPNSSCGISVALPAAASWGARAANNPPVVSNVTTTTLSKKHNEENQDKGNLGNPVSVNKIVGPNETPVTTALPSFSNSNNKIISEKTPQPLIMEPTALNQNLEKFENIHTTADLDLRENTIISNILSMEFDPWDESLTSPQNLAKFLGESNNNKQVLSSRKQQNSNQSRFSFARQDDCTDQGLNYAPSLSDLGRNAEYNNNNSILFNNLSNSNGFSSFNYEKSDHFAAAYPENKISVSRTQVPAPPGFSGPSRAPPPGFISNNTSGINNLDTLRKQLEASAAATVNNVADLEFMDPAILAVGGRVPVRSNPNPRFTDNYHFENDTRLQLLMQSSFSHQNPRFSDNYQQTGYWNGGNDRMGVNRYYYSGHEDTKFQLSTSSDLFNRAFGI